MLEQVSFIAAIEHYTAVMGEWILNSPQLDAVGADPVMLDMLRWHGAEEVEHKAVAFDTMKHLRAGYWRQVRAQLTVTPVMLLLWIRGVRFMYSVDPYLPPGTKPRWRDYFKAARRGLVPGCRGCFGSWGTTTSRVFTRPSWAGWGRPWTTWPSRPPRERRTDR